MGLKSWSAGDKILASDLNSNFNFAALGGKFGDESDGAFSQNSGTTTWNTLNKFIYQFTSFSLTGTAALTLGANLQGIPVFILVDGDLTITSSANPAVNANYMGGAAGLGATSANPGGTGTESPSLTEYQESTGAGAGGSYTGGSGGATRLAGGGGGGAGVGNNGVDGTAGAGPNIAAGGKAGRYNSASAILSRIVRPLMGSGGGGGGYSTNFNPSLTQAGANGGRGGGCIIFIVKGNVNVSSIFQAGGEAGSNAGHSGNPDVYAGSGGGGGGGFFGIYYFGSLTANTATFTVMGGSGGLTGQSGGGGGAGRSEVRKINSPGLLV